MKTLICTLFLIATMLSFDGRWAKAATVLKFELTQDEDSKDNTVCPDGSTCAGAQTCCPIGGGRYGCCPYLAGTCCPDLAHCCPYGRRCAGSVCVGVSGFEAMVLSGASKEKSDRITI